MAASWASLKTAVLGREFEHRVGEHLSTRDHQVVTWELVLDQTQEVKVHVKRPSFFKVDYELKG